MATPSDISVGLVHELAITATKVGWEPEDFAALAHSQEKLRQILTFVRNLSEIKPIAHAIDCYAAPFIPNYWRVEEHQKGGNFVWDPDAVKLYLADEQKSGRIGGNELRKKLRGMPVLNATVLDYLLKPENQHLIPGEYKGKAVFFWGTIYRNSDDNLYVRYLYWCGVRWDSSCSWLDGVWDGDFPAALRAS